VIIIAKRAGTCRACGGHVRKGEEVDFSSELGVAHVEKACREGEARFRPNGRAGRCRCGAWVKAREGTLRLLEDKGAQGGGKRWAVECSACAPNPSHFAVPGGVT
jgi:hypothetical protein